MLSNRTPTAHRQPLEHQVGTGEVLGPLGGAQLALRLPQPALQVAVALSAQLGAVGLEELPALLLGGGMQPIPQRPQLAQALSHHGAVLRLAARQLRPLLWHGGVVSSGHVPTPGAGRPATPGPTSSTFSIHPRLAASSAMNAWCFCHLLWRPRASP